MWHNLVVPLYPTSIDERLRSIGNNRTVSDANAAATAVSFVCGSFVRLSLLIDVDGTIHNTGFESNGCGFMLAAVDAVCEWLEGKALTDLHGLNESELISIVPCAYPTDRRQCAGVVFEALHNALAEYRTLRLREFKGEQALICTCFGIGEETIVSVIESEGLSDVSQVADVCRAGSGCGSCRMLIQELIDVHGTPR